MLEHLPIPAVSGWSGSGKTTLLVETLPPLAARGLSVAVVKHDIHGLNAGPAEKDGNRLFAASAVPVRAPGDSLLRVHSGPGLPTDHDQPAGDDGPAGAPWPANWPFGMIWCCSKV